MSSTLRSTPSYDCLSLPDPASEHGRHDSAVFSIVYRAHEYVTFIPESKIVLLDQLKAAFLSSLQVDLAEPRIDAVSNDPTCTESLVLFFVGYLLRRDTELSAISAIASAFQRDFLQLVDIHSLVSTLPESANTRNTLLKIYYAVITQCNLSVPAPQSALFQYAEKGEIDLIAIFGGQGAFNPRCVDELRELYHIYSPLLTTLVDTIDSTLFELCRLKDTRDFYYGREISLKSWLNDPESVPDNQFVATAAVSFPIIGAISLAHFCVVCKVLEKTPGQVRPSLKGLTGHSQGIIVAAGVSRSDGWPSFYESVRLVTKILFWLGYESHIAAPRSALPYSIATDSIEHEEGQPSSMLLITGLIKTQVDALLSTGNAALSEEQIVYLALSNTRNAFVLAGPTKSLVYFTRLLRDLRADPEQDQSRVAFDRRKPVIKTQFLPISAPFHTPYLQKAGINVRERLTDSAFHPSEILTPVYHTRDGSDMSKGQIDVLSSLIEAVTVDPIDWPATLVTANSSHVLAFGKGVGEIIAHNTDGLDVKIIFATHLTPVKAGTGARCDIFAPHLPKQFLTSQRWKEKFRPRLFKSPDGAVRVENRLTHLLGVSPVLVAGMTPTTVSWNFASTIMNAGYYVELAGGGFYNAESMSAAISKLCKSIPPGRGISCNLIYVSPAALAWQIPMLRRLAQKKIAIEGLTIGAGVPSLEVAAEYITSLGLKYITFKPGSSEAIKNVLKIAEAHPAFPVIIQWTGGRGGGHHSFEDFHKPILDLYGKIRSHDNVYLVAGSGFGNAQDSYPYLAGSWSSNPGYAEMPFDGILLGSRMMVAKEALTSQSVKELIYSAKGADDSEWTKSYSKPVGGILTVQSEMGQPIHKIANRAVRFWKEMDDQVFDLPRSKQLEAIQRLKEHIIHRLNTDFAKPWFGLNASGRSIEVSEMTYSEVLKRLVDLMYISHQKRWVNESYSTLVFDFSLRIMERMGKKLDILETLLSSPANFISMIHSGIPELISTLMYPEDCLWFVARCKSRGQKPVNFVPIIDEDLSFWMKKDSLWQSEDIEAVPDQDPERVCILHGPVAAKYSERTDQPAKNILDEINYGLAALLLRDDYSGMGQMIPRVTVLENIDQICHEDPYMEERGSVRIFRLGSGISGPNKLYWLKFIAKITEGWMQSIFTSSEIVRDGVRQPNYLHYFLESQHNGSVHVDLDKAMISLQQESIHGIRTLLEIKSADERCIHLTLFEYPQSLVLPITLTLALQYDPLNHSCNLQEISDGRIEKIQAFYSKLWLGTEHLENRDTNSTFEGRSTIMTREMLEQWLTCVGLSYSNKSAVFSDTDIFPINACMVVAWEALVAPLTTPQIAGDLLKLVHLSNSFELATNAQPLRLGDIVNVRSNVSSIVVEDMGKTVTIAATIFRENLPVVHITSKFLIKGSFASHLGSFRRAEKLEMIYNVATNIDEAVLLDRKWFKPMDSSASLARNGRSKVIGHVSFQASNCRVNPVLDFLHRKGTSAVVRSDLESSEWEEAKSVIVKMPRGNRMYSRISRDTNPIHTSPVFAHLAGLPGPIVHGMYTSAVTGSALDYLIDDLDHSRLRRFSVTFVDVVLPGDELTVQYRHIAMIGGRMVYKIRVSKINSDAVVLEGEAELEQAKTAYMFTGQGSQSAGMGMDLYKSSAVAKRIWDEVDSYFSQNYGWSILKIVRDNPTELTIFFSGKRGREIRSRYLAMKVPSHGADGKITSKCVLEGLTSASKSYTFRESRGLLFLTQFAQPAVTTLEKAAFEDMRANGLIQEQALFGGHSLGEYAALAALAEFMPFEKMMDVVFYRGLSMQTTVDRDANGSTDYTMVAVNPARVNRGFREKDLQKVAQFIASKTNDLLEIVNFNVAGEQYVCAGTLRNLFALTEVLNELSKSEKDDRHQWSEKAVSDKSSPLHDLVEKSLNISLGLASPIELKRGVATIPLTGIDVPFHSSHLRSGVAQFRRFLLEHIRIQDVQLGNLEGRFVPNVIGRPFSVDRAYIEEVERLTGSKVLKNILVAN